MVFDVFVVIDGTQRVRKSSEVAKQLPPWHARSCSFANAEEPQVGDQVH